MARTQILIHRADLTSTEFSFVHGGAQASTFLAYQTQNFSVCLAGMESSWSGSDPNVSLNLILYC